MRSSRGYTTLELAVALAISAAALSTAAAASINRLKVARLTNAIEEGRNIATEAEKARKQALTTVMTTTNTIDRYAYTYRNFNNVAASTLTSAGRTVPAKTPWGGDYLVTANDRVARVTFTVPYVLDVTPASTLMTVGPTTTQITVFPRAIEGLGTASRAHFVKRVLYQENAR